MRWETWNRKKTYCHNTPISTLISSSHPGLVLQSCPITQVFPPIRLCIFSPTRATRPTCLIWRAARFTNLFTMQPIARQFRKICLEICVCCSRCFFSNDCLSIQCIKHNYRYLIYFIHLKHFYLFFISKYFCLYPSIPTCLLHNYVFSLLLTEVF